MRPRTFIVLAIIIISIAVFQYQDYFWPAQPCSKPLEFSIGTFDTKFGISQEKFVADIEQAGSIWSKNYGKTLFKYSANGDLKINLIYDSRQAMTNELKQQDVAINSDKAQYDSLKAKYNSLVSSYDNQKVIYENLLEDYKNREASFSTVKKSQDTLNSISEQINILVPKLNALVQKLNLKVAVYNAIGSSNGEEFSEGEYIYDSAGAHINIYQFENNNQLIQVLEHELGHALGLDHVADSNAIMYHLNTNQGTDLTSADMLELSRICDTISI
jgi:hypothetical protein